MRPNTLNSKRLDQQHAVEAGVIRENPHVREALAADQFCVPLVLQEQRQRLRHDFYGRFILELVISLHRDVPHIAYAGKLAPALKLLPRKRMYDN